MTTANISQLEAVLRDLLPSGVSNDAASYVIDGSTPGLVATPSTADEVASALGLAHAAGAAVVPWGGGTHMSLGMPPARYDLALDLRRLDRLIEYEPADLTLTVEAGMRLSELQRRLAERGQWLPLDPPVSDAATIGGVLAVNASGPARVIHGTVRDLLIGIRVATPEGELVKAGGRVVKNVAGYDLGKLHIGALGTLGVIVQASFKVAPLPARRLDLALTSLEASALLSVAGQARQRGLALGGIVLSRPAGDSTWTLHLRLAGGEAAVDRSRNELADIAAAASLSIDEAALPTARTGALEVRVPAVRVHCSVLPSTLQPVLDALSRHDAAIVCYPSAGAVYAIWPAGIDTETLHTLRRLCVEQGKGALVLEVAPPDLKRDVDVWGDRPASFALMRRLKDELDPKRVLNPGRYVGGL
jgi:glycolate oxidase FAD binding subunit